MIEIKPDTNWQGNGADLAPPLNWIVLDIETCDPPKKELDQVIKRFEQNFSGIGKTKDPEKIEAQRIEAVARMREKAALLDISPIICIAASTPGGNIIFNGMDPKAYQIKDWLCVGLEDEKNMLTGFGAWLDTVVTDETYTVFVGHNLRGFDLPKIRNAYIRNGLKLPGSLCPTFGDEAGIQTVDTMHLFKAFSMEHRNDMYVSLDTVAESFGINGIKSQVSGADVPKLHRQKKFETILTYCALDTTVTTQIFKLMGSI